MKKTSFSTVRNCLEPLLKNGLENDVFSGVAVGVYSNLNKREERLLLCQGKTIKNENGKPISKTTFFDLASLTKPLCTVLSILHLVDSKTIYLDTKINEYIRVKNHLQLKGMEIKHLLTHSSGLKAYVPFYKDFYPLQKNENKQKIIELICNEKTEGLAGEKNVYSDLGYILLGELIENVSGGRLDDFFISKITRPLGLEHQLLFMPVDSFGDIKNEDIAATQNCPWRGRVLQGEVDDEHSWLMKGIAGHAGLFGTVEGVLEMCIHILKQWKGREEHPSYSNVLLQKAFIRQNEKQTWCLGFDTPSTTGSSSGELFSPKSVGHLGFTGTSFWVDPEKEVVVVLLTNRVHPDRSNDKVKQFRPLLHDTVMKALVG